MNASHGDTSASMATAAGERAQHESHRYRDNVEYHVLFGPQRISELKSDVERGLSPGS